MSLGYLGIHIAWGLQMANSSALFESLGARIQQLPLLWIVAPLSGLLIQPLVGLASDRTQSRLGKRQPYMLVGALFSFIALALIPHASSLWFAFLLIGVLDIFANICMTPFRSFVVDKVHPNQQTQAFSMQSVALGLGVVIASILPWCLEQLGGETQTATMGAFPTSITLSFYVGSVILLGSVLWTLWTAPPDIAVDLEDIGSTNMPSENTNLKELGDDNPSPQSRSPLQALLQMPVIMKQLAWVKGFSWGGLFCLFLYFPPAVAHNIFGAQFEVSSQYAAGIEWAGLCIGLLYLVSCIVSFGLPAIAQQFSLPLIHAGCLFVGAVGLIALHWVHSPMGLLLPICGLGVALASMLSLPYAMLAEAVPIEDNGLYMGIFNCFIVLPQMLVSVTLGWVVSEWLGGDRMSAVVLGGGLMLISAIMSCFLTQSHSNQRVPDQRVSEPSPSCSGET